jgi:hypothetical protein
MLTSGWKDSKEGRSIDETEPEMSISYGNM